MLVSRLHLKHTAWLEFLFAQITTGEVVAATGHSNSPRSQKSRCINLKLQTLYTDQHLINRAVRNIFPDWWLHTVSLWLCNINTVAV